MSQSRSVERLTQEMTAGLGDWRWEQRTPPDAHIVDLGGSPIPSNFTMTFSDSKSDREIVLDLAVVEEQRGAKRSAAHLRARSITFRQFDESEFQDQRIPAMVDASAGLAVFMHYAKAAGRGDAESYRELVRSATDAFAEQRRRRRGATLVDGDVEAAADAYRTGGIAAVVESLRVGERQAWRYVKEARKRRYLPERGRN